MKKSWSEYLKRLANDKVSNLLLSIMFLFDAVHFAFIEDSKILLYISFLPLVLDIIWCDAFISATYILAKPQTISWSIWPMLYV